MDKYEESVAINAAVNKEATRAYHEYMDTPWYRFRKKTKLGHYLDYLHEFSMELHEDWRKIADAEKAKRGIK